ncbi:hypothetical protein GCM10023100_70140 [Actinocorallia cavernae]|uniref:Uncharacterized protein n=2 Tax=Actinomycetes TaxID=1760 RepID=A0ABP5YK08_9ACTN
MPVPETPEDRPRNPSGTGPGTSRTPAANPAGHGPGSPRAPAAEAIGRRLGKPVLLSPESDPLHPVLGFNVDANRVLLAGPQVM